MEFAIEMLNQCRSAKEVEAILSGGLIEADEAEMILSNKLAMINLGLDCDEKKVTLYHLNFQFQLRNQGNLKAREFFLIELCHLLNNEKVE